MSEKPQKTPDQIPLSRNQFNSLGAGSQMLDLAETFLHQKPHFVTIASRSRTSFAIRDGADTYTVPRTEHEIAKFAPATTTTMDDANRYFEHKHAQADESKAEAPKKDAKQATPPLPGGTP